MPEREMTKGFTRKSAVKRILGPYEDPPVRGAHSVKFWGLSAGEAEELLANLPTEQKAIAANPEAPSFGDLVEAARAVPGKVVFTGFRYGQSAPGGERIVLTELRMPPGASKETLDALLAALPGHAHQLAVREDGRAYMAWDVATGDT